MKKIDYKNITGLEYTCSCAGISKRKWNVLMHGAVRADKRQVNRLIRLFCPDMYEDLALKFYNPYNYLRTSTHLIVVHSGIEYFFRIKR